MKLQVLSIVVIFLLITGSSYAHAGDELSVQAAYASFYIPSESITYIEIYYGVYRHQLGFVGSDENTFKYAGILATARISDTDGKPVDSASTYFLCQVKDESELAREDIRLFDFLPVKLGPGSYRIDLTVIDDVSKKTGSSAFFARVPDYSEGKLAISDIELAYNIQEIADTAEPVNSRLAKENRLVIPNPTGTFDIAVDTAMYVYAEIYNLSYPGEGGFTVAYKAKDSSGTVVHEYGEYTYDKPGPTAVLATRLNLQSLPLGTFNIVIEVTDQDAAVTTLSSQRFTVWRRQEATAITSNDVQTMVNIAWYHLSEAEKMRIKDLSDDGKINLIQQFWRDSDNDPSTPENPVYDEAVRRFVYANEHFSTSLEVVNGWRTDRGRVYITYGPYDEEVDELMAGRTYPYILWRYYQLEGGCIFVFASDFIAGAADYRLVHSTHPRERYDPKWENILQDEEDRIDQWQGPGNDH